MRPHLSKLPGRQNYYVRVRTTEGKRSWKTTGTSDLSEAEKIATSILKGEIAKRSITPEMAEALLPDAAQRAFRLYVERRRGDVAGIVSEALKNWLALTIQKTISNNPRFSNRLPEEAKTWAADVVQSVVQGKSAGETPDKPN